MNVFTVSGAYESTVLPSAHNCSSSKPIPWEQFDANNRPTLRLYYHAGQGGRKCHVRVMVSSPDTIRALPRPFVLLGCTSCQPADTIFLIPARSSAQQNKVWFQRLVITTYILCTLITASEVQALGLGRGAVFPGFYHGTSALEAQLTMMIRQAYCG